MAVKVRKKETPQGEIPIAPMIDVVFLLLIYFMVSASLHREEADIRFQLPGTVEQETALEMPDEQFIEITAEGRVIVNDFEYDSPQARRLIELEAMLTRFQETSRANQGEAIVTLQPHADTPHQNIVRVLDACSAANISAVNFALGEDGI
ncbi:MAG: biopolymer transporter ExbD [Opitutales bacterium]|nr:biopolymer transporter ExbD [Opitutales bacterium]